MGLIYQYSIDVTDLNIVVFIRDKARNIWVYLSATSKDIVNIEIIDNLLYFICNNRKRDKVL